MRFYTLLSFQHVILYLIPSLIFILIFGLALGYNHFRGKESEKVKKRIYNRYPGNIEETESPFPLSLILIILGAVLWAFLYILATGLLGVRI